MILRNDIDAKIWRSHKYWSSRINKRITPARIEASNVLRGDFNRRKLKPTIVDLFHAYPKMTRWIDLIVGSKDCRRNSNRSRCMKMTSLLLFALLPSALAFQTISSRESHSQISLTPSKFHQKSISMRQESSKLNMMSLEDIMFNAQSTASSMASISLDDPSNLLSSVPIMYGAGLLTAFSPCVWGLLPLTISYISTAAGEREDKEIILPTLSFALGLASVFCSLGLIAATVGGAVYGNSGNTNIVLPIFSNAICCVMGFQLLELIDIPLPALATSPATKTQRSDEPILIDGSGKILPTKNQSSNTQEEQGSLFRTFLLGGSSALVASPCATPVLTSILAFVASSSNPLLGGFLLLFYTLGYVGQIQNSIKVKVQYVLTICTNTILFSIAIWMMNITCRYSTPLLVTAATGGKALVGLKELGGKDESSVYAMIAPWVTPFTAGILLWYGTNGLLTAILGDPSLAGLLS